MLIFVNISVRRREEIVTTGVVCAQPSVWAVILDNAGGQVLKILPGGRFIRSQGAVVNLGFCLLSHVPAVGRFLLFLNGLC